MTEVGFQQGLFKAGSSRDFFMRVSQHAKPIGGVNCEKDVSNRAFGTSNLDIFMIDGSDQQSESDTFEYLQFFVKKKEVKVRCDGVCGDPDHPDRPNLKNFLQKQTK